MDDTDGFAEPRDRRSSTTKVGYLQQVDLDEDEDGMAPRRMGVKEHSSKDGGEATIAGTTFNLVNNISYNYREMGFKALGQRAGNIIQLVMLFYTLGDFVPHVLVAVAPGAANRILDILVIATTLLLPLSLLKDLNKLRFTSAAALVCIAYTTCLIVANFLSADKYSDTVKTFHLEQGVFASLPIANVAFTLHYNAPRYYQELKNRSIPQLRKATLTAFSLCICVYCFSAIGGYMVFGERTEGNILNNYADDDIGADIARVALTFVIVFTYPLAFHSLRSSVLVFAPAWLRNSQRTRHHVAITVAILSFTTLMGILLPQVQVVLGFNGAIFGSCMVYIFPALMYASLRQQHKRRRAGSLLMPSVGGVQLVSLAATPHLVAGGTGAAEVDENSLATPVFNPTANDSDFAGSGTATGSSRPPWHFAVDFMKTREGIPYAVLVGFGLVVAFLGLLVTVGVL